MKYISTLIVAIAIMAVGTVNAQTGSQLNGRSYTYMMKNADGSGPEIQDQITFTTGQAFSQELGKTGYNTGSVVERAENGTSNFELTFKKGKNETYKYAGKVEGSSFYGTITYVDASGKETAMLFRGMTTEEYLEIRKMKEANPNTQTPH